jgi:membrane-associated protease RseP (regulator of RpoE activity)
MRVKYVVGLLAAIILTVAPALAQQPAPEPPEPPEDFNTFSLFIDGGGFLGVYGEDINNENMARYRLNQARGVGITRVIADSPAEKAGLKKDDVILRLDGENVTSVRKLNRLVSEIAPDHTVKITISRNGTEQELTATMGKRRNNSSARDLFSEQPRTWKWEGPNVDKFNRDFKGLQLDKFGDNDLAFYFTNSRRIGVSTVELTKQLADYFGITGGRGVLVTAVVEDGPAAKAGIKAGDVITAVDGEAIDSPGDIARVIGKKKEGEVTLTIVRNKSQQTFRVTPQDGGFHGTFGRPTVGRQIVVPRVTIPDIVIPMPRIEIPTVPSINIEMPRIRVTPRIRRARGVYGPI